MTQAADIVRLLHARPPAARPRPSPVRNHWQAFVALWRHGGEPAPRDQRGLRWSAAVASLGLHLGFGLLLLWFALVGLPPPPQAEEEGSRVRIEFIGRGTPEDAGGGAPDSLPEPVNLEPPDIDAVPAAAEAPAMPARPDPAQPAPPALAAEPPPLPRRELPEPAPPLAQQPLQVTETPQPTIDFVLPPPTPRLPDVAPRSVQAPELEVPEREIVVPVRPAPPALPEALAETAIATPRIAAETPLRTREVPAPPQPVATPEIPIETRPIREISARIPEIGARAVPAPQSAPARDAQAAEPRPPAAVAATPQVPSPGPPTGTASARPAPVRADDWGLSDRNVPGQNAQRPGLFNRDGSVRLPGEGGAAAQRGGAPGGENDTWTRERIAQAGTWLQRPPYDYAPTRFDQYWVPSESLLAEWVRRNIREMEIPIPGTSMRLSCVISILQLGGGCGLTNPNLQDNPAGARPPPDIPFKPELQEDNGSLPPNLE